MEREEVMETVPQALLVVGLPVPVLALFILVAVGLLVPVAVGFLVLLLFIIISLLSHKALPPSKPPKAKRKISDTQGTQKSSKTVSSDQRSSKKSNTSSVPVPDSVSNDDIISIDDETLPININKNVSSPEKVKEIFNNNNNTYNNAMEISDPVSLPVKSTTTTTAKSKKTTEVVISPEILNKINECKGHMDGRIKELLEFESLPEYTDALSNISADTLKTKFLELKEKDEGLIDPFFQFMLCSSIQGSQLSQNELVHHYFYHIISYLIKL